MFCPVCTLQLSPDQQAQYQHMRFHKKHNHHEVHCSGFPCGCSMMAVTPY